MRIAVLVAACLAIYNYGDLDDDLDIVEVLSDASSQVKKTDISTIKYLIYIGSIISVAFVFLFYNKNNLYYYFCFKLIKKILNE